LVQAAQKTLKPQISAFKLLFWVKKMFPGFFSLKISEYQKCDYEVHQVGQNNSVSQNVNSLAFMVEVVGVQELGNWKFG
jgi:hypothetical protein